MPSRSRAATARLRASQWLIYMPSRLLDDVASHSRSPRIMTRFGARREAMAARLSCRQREDLYTVRVGDLVVAVFACNRLRAAGESRAKGRCAHIGPAAQNGRGVGPAALQRLERCCAAFLPQGVPTRAECRTLAMPLREASCAAMCASKLLVRGRHRSGRSERGAHCARERLACRVHEIAREVAPITSRGRMDIVLHSRVPHSSASTSTWACPAVRDSTRSLQPLHG